jgi:hypothetical protein
MTRAWRIGIPQRAAGGRALDTQGRGIREG